MRKVTNNSTSAKKIPKSVVQIKTFEEEYYRDMFTMKLQPVSVDYLLKFALEWVEWVMANDWVITLTAYINTKGVHKNTVDRWIVRCPELKEASDFVRQIIAERRDFGAATRKYSDSWIKHTHPLYDPEFKQLEEWRSSMKEKIAGAGGGKIVVEMSKSPNSDLVPERKIKPLEGE